jgi:hypothetical protein
MSLARGDEQGWFEVERSYIIFMITTDSLGLSIALHTMLTSPVANVLYTFPERQKNIAKWRQKAAIITTLDL